MTDCVITDPNDKTPEGVNEVVQMNGCKLNSLYKGRLGMHGRPRVW